MVTAKSLDEYEIIAAALCDIQTLHCAVFTKRHLRLTLRKVKSRMSLEGIGFLTKTLPRLAKALDRALTGECKLISTGFRKIPGSELPRFLGELFQLVFSKSGELLPTPCVTSITSLRQILMLYYKYELPFEVDQEQEVLNAFERTDCDLIVYNSSCTSNSTCALSSDLCSTFGCPSRDAESAHFRSIIKARKVLKKLFETFDVEDIYPRHGPGSVSTKETGPGKYQWSTISPRITETYPLDAYFYTSLGHVCDRIQEIQNLEYTESSAKVVLVPKDSRGPRLISEEPLAFQWIQQGLGRAIMRHVEQHPLTRCNVHFTDQTPNQRGALLGSSDVPSWDFRKCGLRPHPMVGRYATLDLKEASDRVSIGLVRLLFPEPVKTALLNCRSLTTKLPSGKELTLNKFAPMGSALCFPVLALTVWAILTSSATDTDARDSILVYGDDVIVKTAEAENAIKQLESFGLLINRAKSCTKGFFRESCGVDAYRGHNVTPVRLRTVWTSTRSPDVYTSYIAFANAMFDRQYYMTYDKIVGALHAIYGAIPFEDMNLSCPSLRGRIPEENRPRHKRYHKGLQKLQWKVWDVKSTRQVHTIGGWEMLLRYFAESVSRPTVVDEDKPRRCRNLQEALDELTRPAFSVSSYTKRRSSILVRSWR